ncbi:hypothetical protein ig2599ANME_1870 [groundwater metagenome]
MSKLVFLDANVFIWAYNRPGSNSAKIIDLKYLVALDEHYKDFEEYKTPREFIESLGVKPSDTEY